MNLNAIAERSLVTSALVVGAWAWIAASGSRRGPDVSTWSQAHAKIAAEFRDGDRIVVRPAYHSEAVTAFRPHPTDIYGPVDGDFLAHSGRVFAVTTDVSTLPPALAGRRLESEEQLGALLLRRYAATSPRVVYAFRERLDAARVALWPEAGENRAARPCSVFAFETWWCTERPNLDDWRAVGRRAVVVGGAQRPWIWAHPHKDNVLQIVFAQATLGTKLRVTGGLADGAVQAGGASVEVTIRVGDGETAPSEKVVFENRLGPKQHEVQTPRGQTRVTFEIRAASVDRRHFVFDAIALDDATP
ncbi:MAG: hypothetical protein HYY84_06140 [Deltaproteobacteria bacterium]|nr:hypothetical protein [Deltaproteobacteria bacterium]